MRGRVVSPWVEHCGGLSRIHCNTHLTFNTHHNTSGFEPGVLYMQLIITLDWFFTASSTVAHSRVCSILMDFNQVPCTVIHAI